MSRWKGICIIWSYGGKRNDAPATGVWTAIGFAVGLVLGREVEAAPFVLNAGFFLVGVGSYRSLLCLGGVPGAGFASELG